MKARQYYDCFPKYVYNTAFGSLLTGPNVISQCIGIGDDEPKTHNEQCSENLLSNQTCNYSALNDDYNFQQQQSIENIIKILIDFLGEFLLFLSSIIECEQFYSQCQLQRMIYVAERIHQLRLTLLIQINNTNGHILNSATLNIPSISLILHELASSVHCLSQEQHQIGTIIQHPQTIMFTQLLDRLETIIKSCMNCISMNNNNSQNFQTSIPIMFPCLNSPPVLDNSTLSTDCWFPCNGSNICIPWSLLEQMRNTSGRDHIFGLMYGIKDKKIRRKLGYNIREHKSSKRPKQVFRKKSKQKYKRNNLLNEETNFASNQEWTTSSTHDQIPLIRKTSVVSTKEKLKPTEQKEIIEKNERISTNSIISQEKSMTNKPVSSRTISRQQSIVNSRRSSPLFSSNFDTNEPIRSHSIPDRLRVSNSSGRITTDVTSHTEELPRTSMQDHSERQHTRSHLLQQQQSNIYDEDDKKSSRSSHLSFQTYAYRTPSKTTFKMSRENSQSSLPIHNKSINTQHSHDSILSHTVSSIDNTRKKKNTSNITRSNDKQSLKESINENPISYKTHINNVDSSIMLTSHDKVKRSDSILNKSFKQRLTSPLPMISEQRINNSQLKQNIISPISKKQSSINEITSDFNSDNYSKHQMSPSSSFLDETHDNISPLNIIDGPQSAEGEKKMIDTSDNNKIFMSTSHFSPINIHRQRSTSATSDSDDSRLPSKIKKHSSQSMKRKQRRFYNRETANMSLRSNEQGYFNKFMNCFRRMIMNPVEELDYKNK